MTLSSEQRDRLNTVRWRFTVWVLVGIPLAAFILWTNDPFGHTNWWNHALNCLLGGLIGIPYGIAFQWVIRPFLRRMFR